MLERMWGKGNTPALLVGVQNVTATLEISMVISQKVKKQTTSRSSNTVPFGMYPRDAQSYHKGLCSAMFIAALFVIARTWKQPNCPWKEEWIKKI